QYPRVCSRRAVDTAVLKPLSLRDALPILANVEAIDVPSPMVDEVQRAVRRRPGRPMNQPSVGLQSAATNSRPNSRGIGRSLGSRSEEHTSELQSRDNLVCRLLLAINNTVA